MNRELTAQELINHLEDYIRNGDWNQPADTIPGYMANNMTEWNQLVNHLKFLQQLKYKLDSA